MNARIYEIQAEDVHKKNAAEGKEMEGKHMLFQPRTESHTPIRLKRYSNKEVEIEIKHSKCRCIVM